jgi:hypothetical protein
MQTRRIKEDNVVRISSKKELPNYGWAIITKLAPETYNKYGKIVLSFTGDLMYDVLWIVSLLSNAGLRLLKVSPVDKIQMGSGFIEGDCWEAEIKKIGALELSADEFQALQEENRKIGEKAINLRNFGKEVI